MITRRGAIGAGLAGLIPARHKKRRPPVGWQQSVFQLVIIEGSAGSGLFVYSPSPGAGKLVASITPVAGTDSFGNTYEQGITSYNTTSGIRADLTADVLKWLNPANPPSGPPFIQGQPSAAGNILAITSGIGTALATEAKMQFLDSLASGATPQLFVDTVGTGCILIAEAPNPLGTLAGFTVTRGTYQMQTDGKVFYDIVLAGTGANAASVVFSNTLPAAYRPQTTKIAAMAQTRAITAGDAFPRLQVGNTGNVTVFPPAININSGVHFQGAISLA